MPDIVERLNSALDGRYRIERELGEGGMATVYLAEDVKHHRHVALKVLKPELAAVVGADRFLAEIETTAKLQHPHILPLFDSGQADSFLFYVMPYVEGETLRDRIDREKQLPVDEAIGMAVAVAHALQAAHDHGVIHRDIKPGNILLSRGEPLVADFGIALAVGAAAGGRLTETGLSVGTPYYMSPEQATGDQAVGAATDTYALGCVLYEMLIGEPPYLGNTAQAVLGKIIQGLPVSATTVRRSVPANVDAAIRKALEKLPADRFARVEQLAKALGDASFRHGVGAPGTDSGAGRWKRVALGASTVAAAAVAAAGLGFAGAGGDTESVTRQRILPFSAELSRAVGAFTALAPDGSSMVVAVQGDEGWRLAVKPRGSMDATPLLGTDGGQNVEFSPDGTWIVFAAGSELKKRPLGDGTTVTLAEGLPPTALASMTAVAWLDDGTILYEGLRASLLRIPENGGDADTLAVYADEGFANLAWARGLPGSRGAVLTLCRTACANGVTLALVDFEADTTRVLLEEVVRGWYTPTGHLLYVRTDGSVFAAPFDANALELTGPGIPLFEGVAVNVSTPELALAPDGTMLYGEGASTVGTRRLVWVDRAGRAVEVDPSLPSDYFRQVALSPTGDRIAVSTAGPADDQTEAQIWVKELPAGPLTRLTTGAGSTVRPSWSSDGRNIAYILQTSADSATARTIRADGSSQGASEPLLERPRAIMEVLPTRDGRALLFREGFADPAGGADLGVVDLSTGRIDTLLASEFNEVAVSLSPDGHWMTYASNTSGRPEVYVRPFPSGQLRVQVSTEGGFSPVWAHNGRELFFVDDSGWINVATFQAGASFAIEERERLFDASAYLWDGNLRGFDVALDDQRFLMIAGNAVDATSRIQRGLVLVENYFTELEARTRR